MSETDSAFATFERKWLDAQPEQAMVAVFLAPAERARASAFGSLIHELEQTTFGVQEPQVAAAKLAWWQQELVVASTGTTRHPIARRLFADSPAVDPALWSALIAGALGQLAAPAASSCSELFARLDRFYTPVAAVESQMLLGQVVKNDANARLWIISRLLRSIGDRGREHVSWVPMDLLARYGLSRTDLNGSDSNDTNTVRATLLRDYLGILVEEIGLSLELAEPRSLSRRVRTRLDLELASRAHRAADPLAYLAGNSHASRWRSLWFAWREARAMMATG